MTDSFWSFLMIVKAGRYEPVNYLPSPSLENESGPPVFRDWRVVFFFIVRLFLSIFFRQALGHLERFFPSVSC